VRLTLCCAGVLIVCVHARFAHLLHIVGCATSGLWPLTFPYQHRNLLCTRKVSLAICPILCPSLCTWPCPYFLCILCAQSFLLCTFCAPFFLPCARGSPHNCASNARSVQHFPSSAPMQSALQSSTWHPLCTGSHALVPATGCQERAPHGILCAPFSLLLCTPRVP
jgi:hypothetical protein